MSVGVIGHIGIALLTEHHAAAPHVKLESLGNLGKNSMRSASVEPESPSSAMEAAWRSRSGSMSVDFLWLTPEDGGLDIPHPAVDVSRTWQFDAPESLEMVPAPSAAVLGLSGLLVTCSRRRRQRCS